MKRVLNLGLALMLVSATSVHAGHWGYDGQEGVIQPAAWGEVSAFCDGKKQSPIDITTHDTIYDKVKIKFDNAGGTVNYSNNGHAITAVPNSRTITVDGKLYTLAQFHFHTLSEHTVNGKHYDMEMHLVHADAAWLAGDTTNGKLAVLGVFIEAGEKNEKLEHIFNELPHFDHTEGAQQEVLTADVTSEIYSILPSGSDSNNVYSYSGSLTTPTCNEVVSWYVYKKPIQMSAHQIEAYRELYHNEDGSKYDTNRPVQELNGRKVYYSNISK